MTILYGVSVYLTMANIFFLLSAFVSDVMFIRFYLLCAYLSLFCGGWTNFPAWPAWGRANGDVWLLGAIIWPFVTGSFHLQGLLSLIWDERHVRFATEDDEQLWRMVHRRSGMGRLEFKHAIKQGTWMKFAAGETIFDTQGPTASDAQSMHMMVEGTATMNVMHGKEYVTRTMRSGYIFDMAVCNVFGVYIGLERSAIEKIVAESDVLLVRWELSAVEKMATGSYPALAAGWRNMILYSVGAAFSSTCGDVYASNGQNEGREFWQGGRSRDMLEPLVSDKKPWSLWSLLQPFRWLKSLILMHNPIAPPGLRHNSMPTSGMLAKGRILAQQPPPEDSMGQLRFIGSKRSAYEYKKLDNPV